MQESDLLPLPLWDQPLHTHILNKKEKHHQKMDSWRMDTDSTTANNMHLQSLNFQKNCYDHVPPP